MIRKAHVKIYPEIGVTEKKNYGKAKNLKQFNARYCFPIRARALVQQANFHNPKTKQKCIKYSINLLQRKVKLLLIPNYYHYASKSGEMIESGVASARALIIVKTELQYRKM